MGSTEERNFSIGEARAIVADLFKPNPRVYWADLLVSLTVAYGCAGVYLLSPLFSPQGIICFFIAGFALHRVANFIHELAHFRTDKRMRGFLIGWNILAGIPTLMPSFFFDGHMAHHNTHHFATEHDCEYIALGRGGLMPIVLFLLQMFLQPIFVIVRFTVWTPISFLSPGLRDWTLRNFSSFVFVWPCPRQIPNNAPRKFWATMDMLCWLRAVAMFALVFAGMSPWYRIPQIYLLAVFSLSLHYVRSLAAHNYLADGKKMSFFGQLMDSIDIRGDLIFTELLFPVGLRYHALHHLFPSIPYHNLRTAHQRLMAQLPAESPYRQLVYPSFLAVLKELFSNVLRAPNQEVAARVSRPVS